MLTLIPPPTRRRAPTPKAVVQLSPAADSVAQRLVFVPANQVWFLAAAREDRLLLDVGRVDLEVRKDSARRAAYQEAVAARSPVRVGARVRLYGPWGAEDATVSGFDTWNGRIVATLAASPRVDSLARTPKRHPGAAKAPTPLVAAAALADTSREPTADSCARAPLPAALVQRADSVRDSVAQQLLAAAMPPIERLAETAQIASSRVNGCFGPTGRLLMLVSLRAGGTEYVRERVVAVNDSGRVTPLRVTDYRFTAHEALAAFDADGDGVDDLAAKGASHTTGGTVILKLVGGRKLERLTSGFAWESR
jgi:hypothetical protein